MKRTKSWGPLATDIAALGGAILDPIDGRDEEEWETELEPAPQSGDISHERARQLILEQTERLLPPADANALADHLFSCDPCYRFAQDVADRERKRNSGELR
jgi:hypothetical protein